MNKVQKISIATFTLLASFCIQTNATKADEDNPLIGKIVFQEDFDDLQVGSGKKWGWKTAAYEFCTTNPKNNKLDNLTTEAMKIENGNLHIHATPKSNGFWDTGLVTNGDSCDSGGDQFLVKPGDFLLTHVKLPTGNVGAWPGFWTWKDGRNEIDVFEWHSDQPHKLELTNHVNPAGSIYEDKDLIGPDKWVYIGTKIGETSNTWYVGSSEKDLKAVFSDQTGVGPDWSAYMIANLSIDNGKRAPQGDAPIDYYIDSIKVFR
ncbi:hypothetical protein [Shimazuella kribbensis]|uniref:hypothetical protein n=1 Tax=Shimazuella kribbensis TaxID=139808 RepID=UPI0003F8D500|nr:hypothetical protein [Shimazuella kribbensis]